ncbi:MAG: cytochrome b N-terminal domain-containing protein [Chloroflexi bacterium]|nr:cytochrome b N-terminal domain-containing protein [Chloroflexota bacterium]
MSLTRSAQERLSASLPYEELLPYEQPAYVHSYVYLFGVATLASFLLLLASGVVLAAFGPQWWHSSAVGHFVNSLHFWSVQAFFFLMVLHLWATFFQGAWRDGRGITWATGVLTFLVSILTAFTGYLSQQNFDAQWIGVQAKDALNSVGVGAFFDVLNFGQMYGFHIALLPLLVGLLMGVHLTLVRLRGVVRPYADDETDRGVAP